MKNCEMLCKVCVTGGSSYVGSYLIKKLLERGTYIVHATLRNLGDSAKVGLLKSLPSAETRLQLFEADIYNPQQFEAAIRDCQYVFHVATPFKHVSNSNYKDTTEAAVAAVKCIAMSCIKSGTVRRLIYTATVLSASPLKDEGSGFLDCMDEDCWTPSNPPFNFAREYEKDYTNSKTQCEKELLKIRDGGELEVVTLACGLVGGETILSYVPGSVACLVSQLSQEESAATCYRQLRFVEEMCGKLPVIHIDDTVEAHIFCMEKESIRSGRFLCASDYVSSADIAEYYRQKNPELLQLKQACADVPKRNIKWGSTKLIDAGFKYSHDLKMILDDSVKCARRFDAV